jgi:hypothetical protein
MASVDVVVGLWGTGRYRAVRYLRVAAEGAGPA